MAGHFTLLRTDGIITSTLSAHMAAVAHIQIKS